MRKWLVALFILTALVFLGVLIFIGVAYDRAYADQAIFDKFADLRDTELKTAHAAEQAAMAESGPTEKELERVKKLAEERIRQGKNSGIFEKAMEIAIFESNRGRKNNDLYCGYREDRKMRKFGNIEITVIVFYKNEEVFLAIKKTYPRGLFDMEIETYRPGGWEAELKSLYKKVQETKRTQEIQDLKRRFGIK